MLDLIKGIFMTKAIKCVIMIVLTACYGLGQSAAGDIAFIAYNGDGNDDFAFVTLVAISDGTVIYFTDNEWAWDCV